MWNDLFGLLGAFTAREEPGETWRTKLLIIAVMVVWTAVYFWLKSLGSQPE